MANIILASTATQQSAAATVTVNKPSTGTVTDVFVAHWAVIGNVADANMTLPAGWVQVGYLSPTGGPTVKLAYKIAIFGEPSNYTFTLSAAANQTCGISRWSNVDTTQLSDAFVPITLNSATSGTSLTATDIVPESDNAVLIAAFANSTPTSTTITIPSGFTTAHAQTTICRNTVAYLMQTTAGHSNDQIATQALSAGWTALLWAMRPLDLGTAIPITVGAKYMTSNLELTCTLTDKSLSYNTAFRTTALASLQGVYNRLATFIGGFGELDPLNYWDGTGTLPTIGEIRGGHNVFDIGGLQRYLDIATTLGIPMDWIIWRLPWQFTENPATGVDTPSTGYNVEGRRVRADRVADYQTYVTSIATFLINKGARRFKVGSETKGFQLNTMNSNTQTWDYIPYYNFYLQTRSAILAAAVALGLDPALITVGGPYTVIANQGGPAISANAVTFDSKNTVTTPVQSIRYKDDAVTPTWTMNNPMWGYPNKAPLQLIVEFFKQAIHDNTPVEMFCTDFGTANEDHIIKSTDDFAIAEQMPKDHARWGKRMLADIGDGRFANLPIDYTEYYIKPEGTIAKTTNTDASTGITVPGPYLPDNQVREYFAAIKAVSLMTCVEEGIRTPCWWSYTEEANARTSPQVTGGSAADKQAWYGESIIHEFAISDGETGVTAGAITVVGLMNKMFSTDFSSGNDIRTVAVGDTTKIHALANRTKCMVVNKTAGRKKVSVNGTVQILAPYQVAEVTFANAYTLTADTTTLTLTGRDAALKAARKIAPTFSTYTLTPKTVRLLKTSVLPAIKASYTLSGISNALKTARLMSAAQTSYSITSFPVKLIHEPPYNIAFDPMHFVLSGQNANLIVARKMVAAQTSYSLTGENAALLKGYDLAAAQASYSLTGENVSLLVGRYIGAAHASYSLTGENTRFLASRVLPANQTTYTLSGQSILLKRGYTVMAQFGNYSLSGNDSGLIVARRLSVAHGTYSLTGIDDNLIYTPLNQYFMIGDLGTFTATFNNAGLITRRKLSPQTATYTFSGMDVGLRATRIIRLSTGLYVLTGIGATVTWSGQRPPHTPLERIFSIDMDSRVLIVDSEDRIYIVT